MTALDAAAAGELADRIVASMRPTPHRQDWIEELTGLHRDRAWRVYRHLRQTSEHGLTIGTFVRTYRDDVANERAARRDSAPPSQCEQCNSTGFVDAPLLDRHRPEFCHGTPGHDSCTCTAVVPCLCSTGQRMRSVHARILDVNGTHT